ncbi:MAG: PIN domain-containing protein [Longimicrobiales bacterium]
MILADTGAVLALLDADDGHHEEVVELFRATGEDWVLPWAILPEIDYLVGRHAGVDASAAFLADLADGAWPVEWGDAADLDRAHRILIRYPDLELGLVDAVVMAMAERLEAEAIATLDLRDFGAVSIAGTPRLLPRDG